MLSVLVSLMLGCGLPTTQCKWYLVGDDDFDGLLAAEDAIIMYAPLGTCWNTDHWTIKVERSAFPAQLPDGGTVCAVGATVCETRTMRVYKQPWESWAQTALAHEVFHAIDCPSKNFTHAGWSDDGAQYAKIGMMRAEMAGDGGTVVRDTSPDAGYVSACH